MNRQSGYEVIISVSAQCVFLQMQRSLTVEV